MDPLFTLPLFFSSIKLHHGAQHLDCVLSHSLRRLQHSNIIDTEWFPSNIRAKCTWRTP